MRRPLLLLLLAASAAAVVAPAGGTAPRPAPTRVAPPVPPVPTPEQLVKELGDPDYATRERAEAALRERGPAVLPAVRAAAGSPSAEVRRRALALLPRLETLARLEPRRVTLPPEPMTLDDALAEVTRQTGCAVAVDPPGGAERLVFGMTGVTYWEAIRRLAALTGRAVEADDTGEPVRMVRRAARTSFAWVDGAFRVELTRVHEDRDVDLTAPVAGGRRDHVVAVKLAVLAEPRLLLLTARPARVTAALDDRGAALAAPARGDVACPWDALSGEGYGLDCRALTEGLLRRAPGGGTALRMLSGVVPVRAVVARRRVVVRNAAAAVGQAVAVGNETVTVVRVEATDHRLLVVLGVPGDADGADRYRWQRRVSAEDMWGNRLESNGGGYSGDGREMHIHAGYERPRGWLNAVSPNLVIEAWEVAEHQVKFEFKDVPLP